MMSLGSNSSEFSYLLKNRKNLFLTFKKVEKEIVFYDLPIKGGEKSDQDCGGSTNTMNLLIKNPRIT